MQPAPAAHKDRRFVSFALRVAIIAFIAFPLAIAVTVAVRSGLFRFGDGPLSGSELQSLWTLVGAGLAAAATTIGAFLAYSHNRRSLAYQAETTSRREVAEAELQKRKELWDEQVQHQKEVAEKEANERQRLEAAVAGLSLISKDGGYAPKAVVAGALATLVKLDQPMLAMRILAATRKENDVIDADTVVWLIGRVLTLREGNLSVEEINEAKAEAAALLLSYAPSLTDKSDCGSFSWPSAATTQWPAGLTRNASVNVQVALVELMLSQPMSWWNTGASTHTWVIYTLDEAMNVEGPTSRPGQVAAALARCILKVTPNGQQITGIRDHRDRAVVESHLAGVADPGLPYIEGTRNRILRWGSGEEISTEPAMSPIPAPNPDGADRAHVITDNVAQEVAAAGSQEVSSAVPVSPPTT